MTSTNDRAILHDKMQESYDRCQIGQKPKNYLSSLGEFSEELAINPLLEKERQELTKEGQNILLSFTQLRKPILQEHEQTLNILTPHAKSIPGLDYYLDQCAALKQSRKPDSWELTFDLNGMLKNACDLIHIDKFGGDHSALLKELVKLDEKGNIIEYIYAPSLKKWDKEYQLVQYNQRKSVWYSMHILIQHFNLINPQRRLVQQTSFFQNKQESIAYQLHQESQNLALALETAHVDMALKLGIDIEELKIHQHRVWMYLKPRLINSKVTTPELTEPFLYSYSEANDLGKGILYRGKDTGELVGNSALLIYLAVKKKNISADEAGEKMPDNGTSPKEQVKNALRVANDAVLKNFLCTKFASTKKGIISLNYPISLK